MGYATPSEIVNDAAALKYFGPEGARAKSGYAAFVELAALRAKR